MNFFYISFFVFFLGLIFGSFINVVIYRLKHGGTVISGRSKCPKCKKTLGFFDLIPILSFVFLGGKCRYCNRKISYQYPIVELSSGIILLLIYLKLDYIKTQFDVFSQANDIILFIFLGFFFLSLLAIFVYDLFYYIIPDSVILPLVLVSVLYYGLSYVLGIDFSLSDHVLGMFLYSGFFAAQYFLSKGKWVGGGDIKLGLALGLILGWQLTLVSLMIAYIAGSVISIILIGLGKKTRKDIIPFGPFLIASAFISLFWGNLFIDWYLGVVLS